MTTALLVAVMVVLYSFQSLFLKLFSSSRSAGEDTSTVFSISYGAFAGIICMILRYFGTFEDGTCFGILLTNAFWPIADSALRKIGYHKFIEKSMAKSAEKRKQKAALKGGEPA